MLGGREREGGAEDSDGKGVEGHYRGESTGGSRLRGEERRKRCKKGEWKVERLAERKRNGRFVFEGPSHS